MSLYPKSVARCQHIKVNGTQCGSPALRAERYCYFHAICHREGKDAISYLEELETAMLPTLEDANSVQMGLAGVIRQLVHRQIDPKTAAPLLYALQTASANLKRTSFEPEPTRVVIDRESVEQRPIGASAWSKVAGREYDDLSEDDPAENEDNERNEGNESWRSMVHKTVHETPENERLLPGESQRNRYIGVQKQKGLEADPALH